MSIVNLEERYKSLKAKRDELEKQKIVYETNIASLEEQEKQKIAKILEVTGAKTIEEARTIYLEMKSGLDKSLSELESAISIYEA